MNASVIVPVFNAESTVSECISSLLKQEFSAKFEIIVVDDGSTDKTPERIKKIKGIKIIRQKNSGPATARNNGARNARHEIVVFIDADCIAEKNWLEEMVSPFKNKRVVGVQGAYKTKQKEFIARFVQTEIEYRYKKMKSSKKIDWIGSYSAAYRKEIFLKEQGFSREFLKASGEDPDLSYKLSEKGYLLKFNPKAIVYHKHPSSLSDYLHRKYVHAFWRVLLYKKHSAKAAVDSYTPQTLKAQIAFLGLFFAFLVLSVISENLLFFAMLCLFLFIFSTLPFVFFALKRGFFMGLASFFILMARDIAFLIGLINGTAAGVWRLKK